jgi:ABC-type Zn uptake system ZnuABC Zn-binding protein ZnuA
LKILKIKTCLFLSLFIVGFTIPDIQASPESADSSEIKIVATTTLLADFASQITGVDVEYIIDAGTCPAHYDVKPSDVAKVQDADIVLCHGFETFLDDLLTGANNSDAKYALVPIVGYIQWGAPNNANTFCKAITTKLNETYPHLNSTFNKNLNTYCSQIDAKVEEVLTLAKNYNLTGKKAVVMKHQIGYAGFIGLNIVGNWSKSDELMSTNDVSDLITLANDSKAEIIVMNKQSGSKVGKEVGNILCIPSVALTNFPGDAVNTETYLDQLESNVGALNIAFNPPPPEEEGIGVNSSLFLIAFSGIGIILIIHKKRKK